MSDLMRFRITRDEIALVKENRVRGYSIYKVLVQENEQSPIPYMELTFSSWDSMVFALRVLKAFYTDKYIQVLYRYQDRGSWTIMKVAGAPPHILQLDKVFHKG